MQKYLKIGYYLQEIKNNNQYENYSFFFLVSICSFSGYSQNDYPEPAAKNTTRLFYIQHSDNHNTYVYDANIKQELLIRLNLLTHTE
jgi:hypothetical protein